LDAANRLLAERFGLSTISSDAFLGSCIAHGDVPYVFFDAIAGQMTGVGLDPYSGLRCSNATWKPVAPDPASTVAFESATNENGERLIWLKVASKTNSGDANHDLSLFSASSEPFG